jgi:hypothetical protein
VVEEQSRFATRRGAPPEVGRRGTAVPTLEESGDVVRVDGLFGSCGSDWQRGWDRLARMGDGNRKAEGELWS